MPKLTGVLATMLLDARPGGVPHLYAGGAPAGTLHIAAALADFRDGLENAVSGAGRKAVEVLGGQGASGEENQDRGVLHFDGVRSVSVECRVLKKTEESDDGRRDI